MSCAGTSCQPWDIALGGDGAPWFTEENVDQIGRITPDGSITEYPVTLGTFPTGIVADAKGKIKEFPVPGESGIAGITPGPDGNLWFTQNDISQVGSMTPTGKLGKTYSTLPYPFGITSGRENLVLRGLWERHQPAHPEPSNLRTRSLRAGVSPPTR